MIVLPDSEDHVIVSSFVWTKHRNLTDRQTDRYAVAITALVLRAMRTHCKHNGGVINRHGWWQFHAYASPPPPWGRNTKVCMWGEVPDVITPIKFGVDRLRGLKIGVFQYAVTTVLHYREVCRPVSLMHAICFYNSMIFVLCDKLFITPTCRSGVKIDTSWLWPKKTTKLEKWWWLCRSVARDCDTQWNRPVEVAHQPWSVFVRCIYWVASRTSACGQNCSV